MDTGTALRISYAIRLDAGPPGPSPDMDPDAYNAYLREMRAQVHGTKGPGGHMRSGPRRAGRVLPSVMSRNPLAGLALLGGAGVGLAALANRRGVKNERERSSKPNVMASRLATHRHSQARQRRSNSEDANPQRRNRRLTRKAGRMNARANLMLARKNVSVGGMGAAGAVGGAIGGALVPGRMPRGVSAAVGALGGGTGALLGGVGRGGTHKRARRLKRRATKVLGRRTNSYDAEQRKKKGRGAQAAAGGAAGGALVGAALGNRASNRAATRSMHAAAAANPLNRNHAVQQGSMARGRTRGPMMRRGAIRGGAAGLLGGLAAHGVSRAFRRKEGESGDMSEARRKWALKKPKRPSALNPGQGGAIIGSVLGGGINPVTGAIGAAIGSAARGPGQRARWQAHRTAKKKWRANKPR